MAILSVMIERKKRRDSNELNGLMTSQLRMPRSKLGTPEMKSNGELMYHVMKRWQKIFSDESSRAVTTVR